MAGSIETIKLLREKSGAGVMDCKRALDDSNGDIDEAEKILREQGIASAARKAGRDTDQGVIETYIHSGGRIGSMVEINCETDFVARTEEFLTLAHDIAMQVAAMSPLAVGNEQNIEINTISQLIKVEKLSLINLNKVAFEK